MRPLQIFAAAFALLFLAGHALAAPPPRFSVTVEGKGPDVILIPGLASSRAVFDSTAARLKAGHRVHRVQVAGFAGEPAGGNAEGAVVAPIAEALATYIRDSHLRAPAVIGHSMGGEIALMLAARHPEAVGRVLVVDALPFYTLLMDPSATAETARPAAERMRDALIAAPPAQAEAMQRAAMARLIKSAAARTAPVAAGLASDKNVVARSVYELMTTDLRPELSRIKAPLSVLYAWDAAYGVPAEAIDGLFKTAYAAAPTARLERVDGSFHFIMLDQPEAFAAAVDAFLAP